MKNKKVKTVKKMVSVLISEEQMVKLAKIANCHEVGIAAVVRWAVDSYVENKKGNE